MITPNTIIADVQAIRDQFADKLTPDGLAAFDAVIAMATAWHMHNEALLRATEIVPCTIADRARAEKAWDDAEDRATAALSAAGVGGGE